ncbi:hypothetical protein PI126_g15975 [Phytophthora idaei]|nr:hypothetical protein PI126_g15975 [Phytophthora idaei]
MLHCLKLVGFISSFRVLWNMSAFGLGVENYAALTQLKDNPDWEKFVCGNTDDEIDVDDSPNLHVVKG